MEKEIKEAMKLMEKNMKAIFKQKAMKNELRLMKKINKAMKDIDEMSPGGAARVLDARRGRTRRRRVIAEDASDLGELEREVSIASSEGLGAIAGSSSPSVWTAT